MDNELTIFGTPAQDTPFTTPISTPRRVPYRMNPVKMIRQHVPVKVLSTEETRISSPDSDSISTHSMKPMKTKRVKCTIQPSPTIHDGTGDQIIVHPMNRRLVHHSNNRPSLFNEPRDETLGNIALESVPPLECGKLSSHDEKTRTVCHSRGDAETIESNFSSQVAEVSSSIVLQKENEQTAATIVPTNFHVFGETMSICSARKSPNESTSHQKLSEEHRLDSRLCARGMDNGSRSLNSSSERRESRMNESETQKEIEITQKLLNAAASSFHENPETGDKKPKKPVIPPDKPKRASQHKKTVQIQENHTNASGSYKCDKKKFYDPTEIRKFMIKKKCERQAKEKEEKCKKANELAALKRKTEITKTFAHRSRIPLSNNLDRDNNSVKEVPDTAKPIKKTGPSTVKSHTRVQPHESEALCYHQKSQKPAKAETAGKALHKVNQKSSKKVANAEVPKMDDFASIDETEKYFQKRFNDIISICAQEASKIVNAELQSTTEGDDRYSKDSKVTGTSAVSPGELHPGLSSSLEELRFKNPYNFLNILKGKMNLAQDDQRLHEQQNNELFVTPPKQSKRNLEEQNMIDKRRLSDETYILRHLNPELRLSDLNLSANKQTETLTSERVPSHTFVVPDHEGRRKSARTSKKMESKENLDTSMSMSGVQPLPPFKPFVTTPLAEKNSHNIPRILEFSDNKKEIPVRDGRIALSRTYTPDKPSEQLEQSKIDRLDGALFSNADLIQPNSDCLKVQNTSFLLPQSVQLRANTDCDIDQSKALSVDKFNSVFNTDLTLTNIFMDDDSKIMEDFNLSQGLANEAPQMNSSFVLVELYDQMIRSEDEKLLQILKKIQQQKEALNKHLRSEVFALEVQKNEYRDSKDEEKIKTIKKRQRGILLKVTKSILELDKMKKSVIETVEKRKADLSRQKIAMKQKKVSPKQKSPMSKPHGRPSDLNNKTFLVTKQMKTFFGISSSSCTSIMMENGRELETNTIERNEQFNSEISDCIRHESTVMVPPSEERNGSLKDSATSPIPFAGAISIRLDLDPEKLLKLKNSFAEIKIHPLKSSENKELADADRTQILQIEDAVVVKDSNNVLETTNTQDHKSVKIKRPLSPVILPPSKKILQIRRISSGSDVTMPSLNDTTTTDQSDIELRISALQEQLRQRKLEAERLRREEKQLRKEKLRSKEQSLLKQLEAYDDYIKKVSKMLTENVNMEVKKPQIKQSPHFKSDTNDSSLFEQPSFVERSPVSTARAKQIAQNDEKTIDEVETNTEDSEKQLRKADSGILIESEVTEASETADFKAKLHQETLDTQKKAFGAKQVESPGRGDYVDASTKVSPSKNLLRMINDLHSEVHSLSEQLYSSDFAEDIPEDIADAKSEVSENVTNDNTSVSIEEILSDHRSDASDVTSNHQPVLTRGQPLVGEEVKTPRSDSHADSISENEIAESSSINASDPQSEFNIRVETIENLESTSTEGKVVVAEEQISPSKSLTQDVESTKPVEIEVTISAKDETSSSADFDFYNVKNISDIESIGDLDDGNQNQWLSGGDAAETNHSIDEDIKSASSIENLSEASKITSKFEASDESKTSPELIKLDYVNESEGSNVADVNEPVEVFKEVTTMMDALSVSDLSDIQPNSDSVRLNYQNVLTNLNTFFDLKLADASRSEKIVETLPEFTVEESAEMPVPEESAKVPVPEELPDTKMSMDNLEETDISESLEYDAMPVDTTNDTIPSIFGDDFENSSLFGAVAKSELLTLNVASTKSSQEASHEKDRSVEEHLVADFSIPNLMKSTFLVHNDLSNSNLNHSEEQPDGSASLSPVQEVSSELEAPISNVDLEQITENQTPFLQALKRDQENLLARRQDSVDKITVDLFESLIEETCTSLVNTMSRKMRSCDFGLTPASDHFDINEIPDISDKVSESFDKNKAVNDFDDNWYEKRLNLDQERLREAEELRLQQLKIEQEIEELQAQQHIPPYIYLREIPNKPPPPYTPPADQSSKIPTNEVELQDFVSSAIEYVCEELHKGSDIDAITELPDAKSAKKSKTNREVSTYKRFMFDLTKEIAKSILENTKQTESLPWDELSRQQVPKPLPGKEQLQKMIEKEIQVLFGFQSKINKEKLIIQWSRKRKSDFVDDLLIQELQEEEGEWTNYEKDELIIKNQISETLLDDLLDDTVLCLTEAFRKKGFE